MNKIILVITALVSFSALADDPPISAEVSVVGKENVVATLKAPIEGIKIGQTLSSPSGVKFEVKEIDGDMLVLKPSSISGIKQGDSLALSNLSASQKAEDLLRKYEPPKQSQAEKNEIEGKEEPQKRGNKYAGLLAGEGLSTSRKNYNFFVFGARVGGDLVESDKGTFSMGLIFETKGESLRIGSINADSRIYAFSAEIFSRHLFGSPAYFGARSGVGIFHADISSPSLQIEGSGTSFIVGPALGVEIPVAKNTDIQFDLSWIYATSGNIDIGSARLPYSDSSALLIQAGLQFDWR
mgnify:CR=1 FL=1